MPRQPLERKGYLSTKQAAEFMECSERTIRQGVKSGTIPCKIFSTKNRGKFYFDKNELERVKQTRADLELAAGRRTHKVATGPRLRLQRQETEIDFHIEKLQAIMLDNINSWKSETDKDSYYLTLRLLDNLSKDYPYNSDFVYFLQDTRGQQVRIDGLKSVIDFFRHHAEKLETALCDDIKETL